MTLENFDTGLVDYWEIRGTLVNETPLHIGAGGTRLPDEEVDNPVIRLPDGTPFIPGSSLKGVLRSIVEAYLRSILFTGNQASNCYDFFKNSDERSMTLKEFDVLCNPFPKSSEKVREEKMEERARKLCINKKLFGGPEIASHIHIYDALPEKGNDIRTMIKPGNAIDRFLGAVTSEALYKFEIIEPGVKWKFKMRIYGLNLLPMSHDSEARCIMEVLILIFKALKKGIMVGGKVSTGHGLLVLQDAKVTHYCFDPEKIDFAEETLELNEFLEKLERGINYGR